MTAPRWAALVALVAGCGRAADHARVAGTVEVREVSLAALSPGRLALVLADEGDTVAAGDTLAVVEQPGLDERIAEARARHAATVARVRDLEAGARTQELANARAAVDAAAADSTRAAAEYARYLSLAADSIATPSQLDAARTMAETTTAALRQARETLDLVAAGPRAHQLAAARAEAQAAAATAEALEAQRDDLTLVAPAPGIVLMRLAEPGEVLAQGAPVITVALTSAPWVRAYIGQDVISRVRVGSSVRITVDGSDSTFVGVVSEIAPRAEFIPRAALTERERADLVYAIRIQVGDHWGRLKAGMPVDLDIALLP